MPLQTLLSSPSSPCPHILQPGNRFNITGGSWPSLQLRRQTAAGEDRQDGHTIVSGSSSRSAQTRVLFWDSVNGSGHTAGLRKLHEERGKPSPREPREEEPPCAKRCGSSCSAPGRGTRLELERKAFQEPLPKQGLREILPVTAEQLEPEMRLHTAGLPFMQMTVRPYRTGSSPSHSQNEDSVGIQLPEREQENPPGEPHPKGAKRLCTGLASEFPPTTLRTSPLLLWKCHDETPNSISYWGDGARGWASGLGETWQPQTWNRTPGGTFSLEHLARQTRGHEKAVSTGFNHLHIHHFSRSHAQSGQIKRLENVHVGRKKFSFHLKKKIFLLSAHWHRGKTK